MIVQKVNKAAVSGEFWLSNDSDPANLRELLAITYTVVSNINDMLLWRYYYHVAIDGRIHYLYYKFKTSNSKVSHHKSMLRFHCNCKTDRKINVVIDLDYTIIGE